MAVWWDDAAPEDRHALAEVLHRAGIAGVDPSAPWSDGLRDAILRLMARAASDHVFLPIQDVFGWRDRINTPATVGDHNWTWRLPWCVDEWASRPETCERARFLSQRA
jgi:4-alpha-glucanotransferase